MKKSLAILLTAFMAATLVACTSEHSSSTNVNVTTTTDEGTKEYNYTEEVKNGEVTTSETVTETPAGENATDAADATDETSADEFDEDSVTYRIETGYLHVEAPSKDDYWMEVLQFENTTKLSTWQVENGTFMATVAANIDNGRGYVIVGAYEDKDGEPFTYVIIPVNIEGHEIVSVEDGVAVDSLEEYFPVYEYGFKAVDDNGKDVMILAFYGDCDSDYVWLYDGKSGQYADYNAEPSTVTDDNGNKYTSTKITISELVVQYFNADGNYFVIINDEPYAAEEITEDVVLKLQN